MRNSRDTLNVSVLLVLNLNSSRAISLNNFLSTEYFIIATMTATETLVQLEDLSIAKRTRSSLRRLSIASENVKRQSAENPIPAKNNSTKKRKRKKDVENDSSVLNTVDEIQIVKKKKTIEPIPEDQLEDIQTFKMNNLIKSFGKGEFKDFHTHCINVMEENSHLNQMAFDLTVEQADTSIWHELRVGRITASRLHEVSRCTMTRGSLVDKIMGQRSGWSFAMMRGTVLEEFVFEEVKKEFPELERAGLVLDHKLHPFLAASPDGLHKDFVLEIKCPSTAKTFQEYTNVKTLSRKYFAQIQLQMFMTRKSKALLAVAALDFEQTRRIEKIWIPLDEEYLEEIIQQANVFYEKAVFPALKRKFLR
jgi:YqaJ-like viral recombinase domain